MTTLILAHFNPNFKCVIKTDSSDHVLGGVCKAVLPGVQ
jgi:hypothetical protein